MRALTLKEPDALDTLYKRYRNLLRSLLVRLLRDEAEAEDTLQEVFIQVWNRAATYDPRKGRPAGWLLTLARRRAIDRLRHNRAYENATLRLESDLAAPAPNHSQPEPARQSSETLEILAQLLRSIPEAQSRAIQMTFLDGMTRREIAETTRIPLGTIKTRVELGLKKLSAAAGANTPGKGRPRVTTR